MVKILKNFTILLLYLIIVIYSLELLLFFFTSDSQKSLVNIPKTRIERAKERNIVPDLRTERKALIDELKKNKNISPKFNFNSTFANLSVFKKTIKAKGLIPFRGPINKLTISCAEDLKYRLINNDNLGFKNPNDVYKKDIDIVILGDSYAEGLCMDENNDTSGHLRSFGINTINLGVTGSGPLLSLGIFREYVEILKPKNVLYFYFEGNDIEDLKWEKNNTNLKKYLNSEYKQNHYYRKKELIDFLELSEKEIIENLEKQKGKNIINKIKKNDFSSHSKDILELTLLKGTLKNVLNSQTKDKTFNNELFFSIIETMQKKTEKMGGSFIFVYVPSWSRYFTKFSGDESLFSQKTHIIKQLKNKKIEFIDLENFFSKEKNKEKYYPLGYIGHFNSKGYKAIAQKIKKKINY